MAEERILVVDDEYLIRWSLQQSLQKEGYQVFLAETGEEALDKVKHERPDLVLLDIKLPGMDGLDVLKNAFQIDPDLIVIMITAFENVGTVVKAMRLGAFDSIIKPFQFPRVHLSIQKGMAASQLKRAVKFLRSEQGKGIGLDQIVAASKEMRMLLREADRIARSDVSTVLIKGESGTGKKLLARAIHYRSKRENMPFVAVNCAGLPDRLLENELCGHEKRAFTDSKEAKKGLFEIAEGGTLFLDEIGDTNLNIQAKLLRVVEQKNFRRIGGVRDIWANVRIIAATEKNLSKLKEEGKFREDLFYQVTFGFLRIPPLRERPDDILPLVKFFIQEYNEQLHKKVQKVSDGVQKYFMSYPWPGNVRELRNVIERAMILADGNVLTIEGLPKEIIQCSGRRAALDVFQLPAEGISLEKVEEGFVRQALAMTHGNQTHAAKLLGIHRDAFRHRMEKFDISK